MTTQTNTTVIEIHDQHLTGNVPDDFDNTGWVEALEQKYQEIAVAAYPNNKIVVKIDVQDASGYSRPVQIYGDDGSLITVEIEQAADALFSDRGNEFFIGEA